MKLNYLQKKLETSNFKEENKNFRLEVNLIYKFYIFINKYILN